MSDTPLSPTVIRLRDRSDLKTHHIVMIAVLGLTFAGGCLLLSAAESKTLVDGAIPWVESSPLRAVVRLLCLNYAVPTIHAGDVKMLVLGIGSGIALLTLAITTLTRDPSEGEYATGEESDTRQPDAAGGRAQGKAHIPPLFAAQLLILLYLVWSFASANWSSARADLAVGASTLLAVQFAWSFALGHGLSRRAARIGVHLVIGITALTGVLAVWYFYGRNPNLRAKFPFGNPLFLSAALIPGLILAGCKIVDSVHGMFADRQKPAVLTGAILPVVALVLGGWAFALTQSRGPQVALAAGALAALFLALRGKKRLIPVLLAVAGAAFAWHTLSQQMASDSPAGRDATLRLRQYSWSYAWDMFAERALTGHGQAAFVCLGDSYAVQDVEDDPLVFGSRISHAHNEWLEVMADLGTIGLLLLIGGLVLTFYAGLQALSARGQPRWLLAGVMAGLFALCVEESFSVGLRVSELPVVFYTMLGLCWSLSLSPEKSLIDRISRRSLLRYGVGGLVLVGGVGSLVAIQTDFAAARASYAVEEAIASDNLDDAVELAQAAQSSLNPQRALVNRFRLAQTRLAVAGKVQARAVERTQRAMQSTPPQARVLRVALSDLMLSVNHCAAGSQAIAEGLLRARTFIGVGVTQYNLYLVQARNVDEIHRVAGTLSQLLQGMGQHDFNSAERLAVQEELAQAAHMIGNVQHAEAYVSAARDAILAELQRQPFNPSVAVRYMAVADLNADLESHIRVIARPLRYNRTAPLASLLDQLMQEPGFGDRFAPVLERAKLAVTPMAPEEDETTQPWAPEILRIGATIAFARGHYAKAVELLEAAQDRYDELATSARMGAAAYYLELADCRFLNDPSVPEAAIRAARRCLELSPSSLEGRELRRLAQQRLMTYLLASGDEDGALALLRTLAPQDVDEEALHVELGIRYRRLCTELLQRRSGTVMRDPKLPGGYLSWLRRAIELAPNDAQARYLLADAAFNSGEEKIAADNLLAAIELGLPLDAANRFIDVALELKPESEPLQAMRSFVASITALRSEEFESAASELLESVKLGLPMSAAHRYVRAALTKFPDQPELQKVLRVLPPTSDPPPLIEPDEADLGLELESKKAEPSPPGTFGGG